ncbi:hypothetical protein BGC07_07960, partial [Piscirickettsia litoralis]
MYSKRLGFGLWSHNLFSEALALWGDHRVTEFIDARSPLTESMVKEKLQTEIMAQQAVNMQYWPLFSLEQGEFVGVCGLRPYDKMQKTCELGFHICYQFWRQGLAREAAMAVIAYAGEKYQMSYLFAGHNPLNKSSKALLNKLGFVYSHDEYYPQTGLDHPSY